MSQHHPIDDLFSRKLNDHVSETPMHLWEKIDVKRTWQHKILNQVELHKQALMLSFSLVLLLGVCSWHFTKSSAPVLGHFPVPLSTAANLDSPESTFDKTIASATAHNPSKKLVQANAIEFPKKESQQGKKELPSSLNTTKKNETRNNAPIPTAKESTLKMESHLLPSHGEALDDARPEQEQIASNAGIKLEQISPLTTLNGSLEEDRFLGLFDPEPKCAKFKHGQWFLYLDMLASPDIPVRSLKGKSGQYYSYVQNREQTESVEFSYSAGFRLSAVSGFGMAIRTGLNYSQINEQFNYYNENEERIIIDNTYGPNGEIVGTDTTIVNGVRHKVTHNKFQIVDLPIILGYEREYKKFVFSVNAGAHINLYFESDGDFLSPDLEPVSFSSNDPDGLRAFRNHLGIGWYSSLGVQYQLSPRFNVMLEPYFKMYPKGFSRSQYVVDQQYLNMGFSVGIRQKI